MIKKRILHLFNRLGYTITKIHLNDLEHYYQLYEKDDVQHRRFYNIGAGMFRHPAWTNIDYYSEHYKMNPIDINYNILEKKPLPIPDNTARIVYSSHTIEHVTDEAASYLFKETYRILKKNGYLRITAPDINLHYQSVLHNDLSFWRWHLSQTKKNTPSPTIKQLFLSSFATQLSSLHQQNDTKQITDTEFDDIFTKNSFDQALNHCTKRCSLTVQQQNPGEHINWWNKEKLQRMLHDAGFNTVYPSGYGQSRCPILRNTAYFDMTHPSFSLYVEAQK
ncbi:MAG: methyltransferase domain-containing protein [Methanobacteriota archaeon]